MSTLSDLQSQFQHSVETNDAGFNNKICETSCLSVEDRLFIYQDAYESRLIEALATNYAKLRLYLGFEQFQQLAKHYIKKHPSRFASIRWFGDQLPAFLASTGPYEQLPCLAELAMFEWKMTLAFDAADSSVISAQEILGKAPEDWPDMHIQFHPSLQYICFKWNVVRIWQALDCEQAPPEAEKLTTMEYWVIWRQKLINQFCSISKSEAMVIELVLNGQCFADMCERLADEVGEQQAAAYAASLLRGWLTTGIVTHV